MAEYINRDEFYQIESLLRSQIVDENAVASYILDQVLHDIKAYPAADVATVVHGKWKGFTHSAFHGIDDLGDPIYRDVSVYYCSKCNRRTVVKENFCPACGARMDGETE